MQHGYLKVCWTLSKTHHIGVERSIIHQLHIIFGLILAEIFQRKCFSEKRYLNALTCFLQWLLSCQSICTSIWKCHSVTPLRQFFYHFTLNLGTFAFYPPTLLTQYGLRHICVCSIWVWRYCPEEDWLLKFVPISLIIHGNLVISWVSVLTFWLISFVGVLDWSISSCAYFCHATWIFKAVLYGPFKCVAQRKANVLTGRIHGNLLNCWVYKFWLCGWFNSLLFWGIIILCLFLTCNMDS